MTEPLHWHEVPHAPTPGTSLGLLSALPDKQATLRVLATDTPADKPFRYLLLRNAETVVAYVNRCAHFGVPLAERQELLKFQPLQSITCNVHYAKYRWSDGACLSGECDGVGLLAIPVDVDDQGIIRIVAKTEQ